MARRIIGIVVLALIIYAGYYYYKNYNQAKTAESGAFTCVGCMNATDSARFQKENAGETADGQSEHKTMTARQEDASGFTNGQNGAAVSPNAPTTTSTAVAQSPAPQPMPQNAPGAYASGGVQPVSMTPPTTDSQSPNAPNGMHFAGSGNYQWYRQGNVTYRVDTGTGKSCIIYATMEEWRKQVVLSHGCGRDA